MKHCKFLGFASLFSTLKTSLLPNKKNITLYRYDDRSYQRINTSEFMTANPDNNLHTYQASKMTVLLKYYSMHFEFNFKLPVSEP